MQPIRIAFTAYDIHGVAQKHGGDHFVVRVHKSAEHSNRMKQAFRVEDQFDGEYIIHLLLPDAANYNLWILHKFGCFDAMMNDRGHINANMSWHFLGSIAVMNSRVNPYSQSGGDYRENQMNPDRLSPRQIRKEETVAGRE